MMRQTDDAQMVFEWKSLETHILYMLIEAIKMAKRYNTGTFALTLPHAAFQFDSVEEFDHDFGPMYSHLPLHAFATDGHVVVKTDSTELVYASPPQTISLEDLTAEVFSRDNW